MNVHAAPELLGGLSQYYAYLGGAVVADGDGALYGTNASAGVILAGGAIFGTTVTTVFRLTPPGSGQTQWNCSVLHSLATGSTDATGTLIARWAGGRLTLFGSAAEGIFELVAPVAPATTWSYGIIHTFQNDLSSTLMADRSLNLYGVTGGGVLFRLTPPTPPYVGWQYSELQKVSTTLYGPVTDYDGVLYTGAGYIFTATPRDYGGHLLPWNTATLSAGFNAVTGELVVGRVRPGVTAIYGIENLPARAFEIPVP